MHIKNVAKLTLNNTEEIVPGAPKIKMSENKLLIMLLNVNKFFNKK